MDTSWQQTIVHASRPVRLAAAAALSVLTLFLLVATVNQLHNWGHPDTAATNTITVTGTGQATVAPDTAKITFSVMKTGASVAEAQTAATKSTDAALAAVKREGVKDADVRTANYNVYPQYESARPCYNGACPTGNPNTIVGYQVSETVEVKVHDLTKVGNVLTDLGQLGVENIQGPDLTVNDENAVQAQARGDAITKARANATKLAQQLGVHLGRVVSFSESTGAGPQPMYGMAAQSKTMDSAIAAPSVPVATGQNEYSETVSITYEIN